MSDHSGSTTSIARFRLGNWLVEPSLNRISRDGLATSLEKKSMDVLVLLAQRDGDVVSNDDVIDIVWGRRPMGDNPVYKCIANIRKALGDDPKSPTYVETIAGRGYRLLVPVENVRTESQDPDDEPAAPPRPMKLALLIVLATVAGIWFWPESEPTPETHTNAHSVAVIPFENLSGDSDNDYFCKGIADVLLNQLASQTALRVVARTSAFSEGSNVEDLDAFMQRLKVSSLLSGSVQQHDDTLRVSARLTDLNGNVIWSETFDRDRQNLFQLQNEIASAVVLGLSPRSATSLEERPPPTDDVEAYEAYMLGREHLSERVGHWSPAAKIAFESAIERDPDFAEAYAGLGVVSLISASAVRSKTTADWAINEAMRLNPESSEVLAAAGLLASDSGSQAGYRRSVDLLRQALEKNPSDVSAHNWLSISLQVLGQDDEGLAVLNQALELDPLNPLLILNYGRRLLSAGKIEESRERTRFVLQLPNIPPYAFRWLAYIDLVGGDIEAALNVYKQEDAIGRLPWDETYFYGAEIADIYSLLGMFDQAAEWMSIVKLRESSEWWLSTRYRMLARENRLEEIDSLIADFLATRSETDVLNLHIRTTIGKAAVQLGDYMTAIEILEPIFAEDWALSNEAGGSGELFTTLNFLAVAYLRSGREDDATRLLRASLDRQSDYYRPSMRYRAVPMIQRAATAALLDDQGLALTALQGAVDAGWVDYYAAQFDPTLDGLRDLPEFDRLMASVKSTIDIQRARIEAEEALKPFNPPPGSQ